MNTQLLQQARVLNINEQIELVEAIWDGIVSRGDAPSLTEAQKSELDRRLADHLAMPSSSKQVLGMRPSELALLMSSSPRFTVACRWHLNTLSSLLLRGGKSHRCLGGISWQKRSSNLGGSSLLRNSGSS
jgi:putative addiction module component (TIGR02574 family)